MIWDHYIPLAVAGSHIDEPAEQGSPTILDFAGMSRPRLIGEFEAIVRECIAGGAQRLLVNFDGANVMDLLENSQPPIPIVGAVPMPLDTGQPHSPGLLIDAGECVVVGTSDYQTQISELLDRFIADTLIDSTVGAKGQGEHHSITPGGAHIPTWYRIGPLLELEGVTELLGFHLARLLQGKSIDLIIPWAEPGIQLAIRLASRLSEYTAEDVGYVPLVKGSSKAGGPEISDLDAATVRGKRVLLLTDVLCAGETIRTIADEVDRCGGYTKAIAGILSFDRSKPMRNVLGSIKRQNGGRVAEWTKQPRSDLAGPPIYEGVEWLSQVSDPVYPEAGQCKDCSRGKPYVLLWSGDSHRAVGVSGGDALATNSQLARSTLSWSQFWLGAQEARSIGQIEHQVSCSHCHDGQVLDISRLRESTDLWDEIAHWAGVEIEQAIRARSPADTEPIYLVTSPSRGSTILAGELVRQYEQLQGPHIVTRDPHARLWGADRAHCRPAGHAY